MATATASAPEITFWEGKLSIASDFDEYTIDTYTQGDCYILALALHRLGLGELIAVTDGSPVLDGRTSWTHMAVRTPEGYILDVDGLNDPSITLSNYGWEYANGGTIQPLSLSDYDFLIQGQAQSIWTDGDVLEVAEKLQALFGSIPGLPTLDLALAA